MESMGAAISELQQDLAKMTQQMQMLESRHRPQNISFVNNLKDLDIGGKLEFHDTLLARAIFHSHVTSYINFNFFFGLSPEKNFVRAGKTNGRRRRVGRFLLAPCRRQLPIFRLNSTNKFSYLCISFIIYTRKYHAKYI